MNKVKKFLELEKEGGHTRNEIEQITGLKKVDISILRSHLGDIQELISENKKDKSEVIISNQNEKKEVINSVISDQENPDDDSKKSSVIKAYEDVELDDIKDELVRYLIKMEREMRAKEENK